MRRFFLLSIKPEYSERIFCGEKKFELRKRKLGIQRGDIVVVYTSSPTQALTGAFMAMGELELPVETMWARHRTKLGIKRGAFDEYFDGSESAVAIPIGRAVRIPAISLPDLRRVRPGFTPPQSFMYCPDILKDRVLRATCEQLVDATETARLHHPTP
ncbi:MAG TPA: DUF3850 domain-containing protein [Myxococcaceae bacterium]